MTGLVDAFSNSGPNTQENDTNQQLDYKNYGSYAGQKKKRDIKFDEKQAAKRGF